MHYTVYEPGIIRPLTLVEDGGRLLACLFAGGFTPGIPEVPGARADDDPVLLQARAWLDRYFAGKAPDPRELPLGPSRSPFQARVRAAMLAIPYGETSTYGAIAHRLQEETGRRQAAQAVGGAVGSNPLGIIVPCHRVMGEGGRLTGFGGGLDTKVVLLELEGVDTSKFIWPKQ